MAKSYHEQSDPSTSSDGYTKIPHDILETLARTDLSSYEIRVVMVILRMTFGWHKDADTIANLQFRTATGIKDRGNIHRAVRKLEQRRIIVVSRDYRDAATYRINKNLAEWCLSSIKTTAAKKRKPVLSVVHKDYAAWSIKTTPPESVETTGALSIKTPSEDIRKEIKDRKDKAALRAGSLSISDFKDSDSETRKRDSKQEAEERRQLSEYRNKMFKSGMYEPEEWSMLKDKTLNELIAIDTARLLERNPHIAAASDLAEAAQLERSMKERFPSGA